MKYISKKDVVDNGLIKRNGCIYKMTVLEKWHEKGWLELNTSKFTSSQRLYCGLRLHRNFQIINKAALHSGFVINDRVNDSFFKSAGIIALNAWEEYSKTIKLIPQEFWPIVRRICIEDKEPQPPKHMSERQRAYFYYMCRIDICRGLDRIANEYNQKLKIV